MVGKSQTGSIMQLGRDLGGRGSCLGPLSKSADTRVAMGPGEGGGFLGRGR